jgi:hypothetical protein
MSSLWTPGGEHPVDDRRSAGGSGTAPPPASGGPQPPQAPPGAPPQGPRDEAAAAIDDLRRQLAEAPAEVVVANHVFGLFELAAIYLSQQPPLLVEAQLAIDAMGAIVDTLGPRLGDAEGQLKEGLAQLRLAFVELSAAAQAQGSSGNGANGAGDTSPQ